MKPNAPGILRTIVPRRPDRRSRDSGSPPYPTGGGWVWRDRRRHTDRRTSAPEEEGRAQAEGESLFHALVEDGPDAILVLDGRGNVMIVNRQCERMFGYQRDEVFGKSVATLLPERHRNQARTWQLSYVAPSQVTRFSLEGRRADASEFPIELSLVPIRTPLQQLILATVRDASEHRQALAVLQQRIEHLTAANARMREEVETHHRDQAELRRLNDQLEQQLPGIAPPPEQP